MGYEPLLREHSSTAASRAQETASVQEIRERFASLSPKQREVCRLMVQGVLNRKIAERLNASVNTVKTHRAEVFRRMEAQSLLHLAHLVQVLDAAPQDAGAGTAARVEAPAKETPRPPLRVLVVEDNSLLRDAMLRALSLQGHRAEGIANGSRLDRALAAGPVDVVLVDIGLGREREDGIALAQRLRRETRCGIVMVTAREDRDARIRSYEGGADAYLVKPVDFDELNVVMYSVVRRLPPAPTAA
jgi:DNA-binding NarL/FixJ family response regulator